MPAIRPRSDHVTQITTAEVEDGQQKELLRLMTERARFMATQPRFVSHQSAQEPRRQADRQLRAVGQSRAADRSAPYAGVPQQVPPGGERRRGHRSSPLRSGPRRGVGPQAVHFNTSVTAARGTSRATPVRSPCEAPARRRQPSPGAGAPEGDEWCSAQIEASLRAVL